MSKILIDSSTATKPTSSQTGIIVSLVDEAVNDSDLQAATVLVPEAVDKEALDELKSEAKECYCESRVQKYKALAYAYLWYRGAKRDQQYLDEAFKKYTDRSPIAHYVNTVKCCYGITGTEKASTVTKYAKVLQHVEEKLDPDLDLSDTDEVVKRIVAVIKLGGGVNKCSKLSVDSQVAANDSQLDDSADPQPKQSPKKTQQYVDKKMRDLADNAAVATFKCSQDLSLTKTELVIMVGKVNGNDIDVVQITVNDDMIERLIELEPDEVSKDDEGVE